METITIYLFVRAHICTGIILFRNQLIFSVRGGLRMFKLDRGCAMVGGICMDIDDCDPEHLSTTTGLCPSHKNKNVECCYRCKKIDFFIIKIPQILFVLLSSTDKHRANSTCDSYQGECMSYCHPLIRHKTNDCGDQWCCTLV